MKRGFIAGTAVAAVALAVLAGENRLAAHGRDPRPPAHRISPAEQLRQRELQIAGWTTALEADSASAIALGQLAGLHLQRGRESGNYDDFTRAESFARRSLALRSNRNGKSFVILASSFLAQHRFAEAMAAAQAVVELEPDVPQYRALLGETQLELGEYRASRASFASLHRSRTHLSIAPRLARFAEISGRTAEARKLLRGARQASLARTDLPPEQVAWFHLRLGEVEARAGRPRAAREAFTSGLVLAPDDYRLLAALARLETIQGHPRKAIELAERSLSERLDPGTLGTLSEAYEIMGDTARAGEAFRAMEVSVAAQPGAYHRAWGLFLLDHNRRVPEVLERARQEILVRRDIYGYDLLAWALFKQGLHMEARRAARQALRLGTEDASLFYHAGMIERALGDRAAARDYLERALTINSEFHPIQARIAYEALRSLSR
jgi:tetratricopeptide (TPR) repeat protein